MASHKEKGGLLINFEHRSFWKDNSLFLSMFREDMGMNLDIALTKHTDRYRNFISETHSQLHSLLDNDHPNSVARLLTDNMIAMISCGIALGKVDIEKDPDGGLKQIKLSAVDYRFLLRGPQNSLVLKKSGWNKQYSWHIISNQQLVYMNLKDLKIRRRFFRCIAKRLGRLRLEPYGFPDKMTTSYQDWKLKHQLDIVKAIGRCPWNARSCDNPWIDEPWFLWREIGMHRLRVKILEYSLGQYNKALDILRNTYSFQGRLECSKPLSMLEKEWSMYYNGEVTGKVVAEALRGY